jgi:hypothetical protein
MMKSIVKASKDDPEDKKHRAFLRVAKIMYSQWQDRLPMNSNLPRLIPPCYVSINKPFKKDKNYSEHVIPLKVICDEIYKKFDAGELECEAAKFMSLHVIVVHITKDEHKALDASKDNDGCGLKQKMPNSDWMLENGNKYARLDCLREFRLKKHNLASSFTKTIDREKSKTGNH